MYGSIRREEWKNDPCWLTVLVLMIHRMKVRKVVLEISSQKKKKKKVFPGGAVVKNPPANAGDTGSSPGPGRSHMPQSN